VAPTSSKGTDKFPFVALPYNDKMKRLHGMFGNFSRIDCRLHNESTKNPRCNWFDPEEIFLQHAHRLPTYGPAYMPMFMKMAKGWGEPGNKIRKCKTPELIDQICDETISV